MLFAAFIHAHQRLFRVKRAFVGFQHILHRTHKLSIGFGWDAPFLLLPRF
jgi:hypothetical protein